MLDLRMPQVLQGAFTTAATIWESPTIKGTVASVLGAIAIACLFGAYHTNDESKCNRGLYIGSCRDNDIDSQTICKNNEIRYQRYETLFLGSALISTIAATAIATTAMLTRR